ncbi:nuclear transport factor 2 family protein [Leptospira sp. 96542]|nr:nuclear transport factor 2 family protein [Leptospira sp. 96542]
MIVWIHLYRINSGIDLDRYSYQYNIEYSIIILQYFTLRLFLAMNCLSMDRNKFIDLWLEAWSGFDIETLFGFYDSEFIYIDPMLKRPITRRKSFQLYLENLQLQFPNWHWQREELVSHGNLSFLKWSASFTNSKKIYGMDVIEFADGKEKIKRNEVYFDSRLVFPV